MFPRALRLASLATTLIVAATGTVHADEATVRKAVEGFIGAPAIESVAKTPYGGLYEVVLKSGEGDNNERIRPPYRYDLCGRLVDLRKKG